MYKNTLSAYELNTLLVGQRYLVYRGAAFEEHWHPSWIQGRALADYHFAEEDSWA